MLQDHHLLVNTLALLFLTSLQNLVKSATPPSIRTCEPIRLEMCKKIGYNTTALPNLMKHETQEDAEQSFQTFNPLISIGCSSQLSFFLCSVHVPMCDEKILNTLGPCRRLCETVRDRCLFILNEFGFTWPAHLNCSLFPITNDHQNMCMEGPGEETTGRPIITGSRKPTIIFNTTRSTQAPVFPTTPVITVPSNINYLPTKPNHSKLFGSSVEDCSELKFHQQYFRVYNNNSKDYQCAHDCLADILYASKIKKFSEFWIAFWATLCLASSMFSLLSLTRNSTIEYPDRTIIYMAFCYLIYSFTHLMIILLGRANISCYADKQYNVSLLIKNGSSTIKCVTAFALLYYTQMSGLIWWLILSLNMYSIVAKRRSPSQLASSRKYYHISAWGLPLVGTIIAYLFGDISADELSGSCFVGNNDADSLLVFIIIPTKFILFIGSLVFFATLSGYFRGRKSVRLVPNPYLVAHSGYQSSSEKISYNNLSSQNSHPQLIPPTQNGWVSKPRITDDLGVALIRLLIFQVFYFFISLYLFSVSVYEYYYRDEWYSAATNYLPNAEVMSLKIFASFLAGNMTGIWIWMSQPNILTCPFKTDWEKTSPSSLQTIPIQPNHHIHPVTSSSLATLDSRGRYYHCASETTV